MIYGFMTLFILSAGIGSRYGGNKQCDPLGQDGAWLMDYAIFDAIQAGFSRVVLVVRAEMRAHIKHHLHERWASAVSIDFVSQATGVTQRKKPWGTAHAVLAGHKSINEPFAMINADDFYGREAIASLGAFLRKSDPKRSEWALVGYKLEDTLSEAGPVSRGVCIHKDDMLLTLTEEKGVFATFEGPKTSNTLFPKNTLASMNCWGFTPSLFPYLETAWDKFFAVHKEDPKEEIILSGVINELLETKKATIQMLTPGTGWMGITYQRDKENVMQVLKKLHTKGQYPLPLSSNEV